jgi:hypothetical protein
MSDNVSNQRQRTPFAQDQSSLLFRGEFTLNADHLVAPEVHYGAESHPSVPRTDSNVTTRRYHGTRGFPVGGFPISEPEA